MNRGFRKKTRLHGLTVQTRALEAAGAKPIYDEMDRDALVNSLRKGDFIVVLSLSCLATNKADLRWVLIGEAKDYRGTFLRGAGVHVLDLDAKLHDMQHVEATLRATEDWANERRKVPAADSVRYGKRGGRPRKRRTDKHVAMIAWGDRVKYPTIQDALSSPHMKGWSQSAATRRPPKGLGPRGGLTGRLPKQIDG